MRKLFCILIVACVAALPVSAQDEDGSSLMERGAQDFLEGLLKEMEPAWREMQGFMNEMGPAMIDLMDQVKDWSAYEAPEMLENGDIIIRRKPDEQAPPAPDADPLPPIEL
ncbi:MAG: hypothetical protein AAF999_11950 [Pseudomonadota bacterium]